MTFTYPRFDERDWSAEFESFDQHRDDLYYLVTLAEGGSKFVARVGVSSTAEAWGSPAFNAWLLDELRRIVMTGRTNTTYVPFPPLAD